MGGVEMNLPVYPKKPAGYAKQARCQQPAKQTPGGGQCSVLGGRPHRIRSALECQGNLVGGDSSFAKDLPRTISGKINNGCCHATTSGAAIDDQRNSIPNLIAHTGSVIALRQALQISRSRSDGQAQLFHDGARYRCIGYTQGHVAYIGCRTQRQPRTGADNQRQRTRPETLCQKVKPGIEIPRQAVGLGSGGNQKRQRLVLEAGLALVNALDRTEIDRVDG